jgi:peptide/nickel transport system permease protein
MFSTIARRLLALIPILIGLSLIVFLIMALIPGDPALAILGSYATPDSLAHLRAQMGLDRPLPVQYLIWLDNILHGDFGRSYSLNRPVLDEVLERFRATLILSTAAFALCSIWAYSPAWSAQYGRTAGSTGS